MNVHIINGPKQNEIVEVDPSFPRFVVFREKRFDPTFDDSVEETAIIFKDGSVEMYDDQQFNPYNIEYQEIAYEIDDFVFLGDQIKIGFLDSNPRPSDEEIRLALSSMRGVDLDIDPNENSLNIDSQRNTEIRSTEGLMFHGGNIIPPLNHDFSRTWQQHRSDYQRREAQQQHDEMMRDLSRRRTSLPRANFGIGLVDYPSTISSSSNTDESPTPDELDAFTRIIHNINGWNNPTVQLDVSDQGRGLLDQIREYNSSEEEHEEAQGLTLDRLREIGRRLFSNNSNQSNTDEDR